jgi:hypothetical protein
MTNTIEGLIEFSQTQTFLVKKNNSCHEDDRLSHRHDTCEFHPSRITGTCVQSWTNYAADLILDHTCKRAMGGVRNVVLINVNLDLENPGGSGFRVGGYMNQVKEWGS